MSVIQTPDSAMARELDKWNVSRPKAEFPKRMYLAARPIKGGQVIFPEQQDADEVLERNLRSRGWGSGQVEALELLEQREFLLAEGAAHRAHDDRHLSESAQREVAQVEQSTDHHVAEIPRKPGRPRRIA